MKIILVSDSHGFREPLDYVREHHPEADLFVHCGDVCLEKKDVPGFLCVAGNHDGSGTERQFPLKRVIEADGHRIYVCHGHLELLGEDRYELMIAHAKREGCDTVFFGHTHRPLDTEKEGIRLLNPGSLWFNMIDISATYMAVETEGILRAELLYYREKDATFF